MAVTTSNLIQGPGTLYYGDYGASEPTDATVGTAPSASTWTDIGGTSDGLTISVNQEYAELLVDQLVDTAERRITKRETALATNMAEPTLTNLSVALNGGTVTASSGYTTYDPATTTSATQPTYRALLFDGYAPSSLVRRVVGRKMLQVDAVEGAYKKEDKTVWSGRFVGHYVSAAIKPWRVIDETA